MRPTDVLRREHELILQGLSTLSGLAHAVERGEAPYEGIAALLEFFTRFADACHHTKEEDMLFPALTRAGLPEDSGPLSVMAHEHDEVRRLLRALLIAADDLDDNFSRRYFAELVRNYVALLVEHIEKENHFLFPIADELLDRNAQDQLDVAFIDFEVDRAAGMRERWERILQTLQTDLSGARRSPPWPRPAA